MSDTINHERRELLKTAAALATAAAGTMVAQRAEAQQDGDTLHFFPAGFKHEKVQTSGATINVVRGGEGPPLLLMHGAPFTHIAWRLVAPELSKQYTLVIPDLRGY